MLINTNNIYSSSNDSEKMADLLNRFNYRPDMTQEILNKYKALKDAVSERRNKCDK